MRVSQLLSIAVVIAVLWSSAQVVEGEVAVDLKAGAAKADITPEHWPHPLVGTFSERLADKAWDRLHARAIVLQSGEESIAIVVIDSCYVPRVVLDEAKGRIAKQTGMRTDHMLMAATHTHSAPASRDRREIKADPRYVERVTSGIVAATVAAHRQLEAAEIGWAVAYAPDEVFNRRWFMKPGGIVENPFGERNDIVRMNPPRGKNLLDRAAGPTDPDISIVSIRAVDGRPIALFANYSLHYVGGVPAGGASADYFGEFARLAEKRLGSKEGKPAVVGVLSNGTSGDINNISFRKSRPRKQPFERIREVAGYVADKTFEQLEGVQYRRRIELAMTQRLLTLDKRRPTPAQVARAKQFLAAADESSLPRRAKPYAAWTVKLAEPPFQEELVLQAIRIGDIGITSIPCEVFVEIGLELKAKSPLPLHFTMELANGHYGYLPTPRHHALGGYETWLGTNTLEEQASVKITQQLLEMLEVVSSVQSSSK
ncbi:MAG: neutral/alkaline non-lysosomal ceramidase N-terminal domain-containing protein [Pirellulaceae bacterium]|nr:neutral/alkaline non-lysosomal ceramidase N-terminal domain-containing protein [Pirellulaceae bacterium]MDP7016290.1 neutral/alkaline non-lysosomal ceramidase N-terminal domain-containing protein [Pirellulaceae bacterium]